jgi:hypothetical protein
MPGDSPKSGNKVAERSRSAVEKITGCLDQQGETYLLRELTEAGKVTTLHGKGFSDDNFARYVGHKVTVHGTAAKYGETTIFQVTKVEDSGPGCRT